ncbi:MAG: PDZ domain-containing protein [Pseudomonadota bacterium]
MKKLSLLACLGVLLAQPGYAGDLETEMKEARQALDEAARRLAELHTSKYGGPEKVKRAMLGVLLGDGPMRGGVPLVGVTPGGGAEQVGIRAGDKIVRIGGIELSEVSNPHRELSQYMKGVTAGDDVEVVYLRDDKRVDAVITTQAQTSHIMRMVTSSLDDLDFDFDFDFDAPQVAIATAFAEGGSAKAESLMFVEGDLAEYFDVDQGVVVVQPPDGSQLKGGDVLLEIDTNEISSVADALVALGQEDGTDVKVRRKGRNVTVAIEPGEFEQVEKEEIRVIRVRKSKGDGEDVHVEIIKD